MVGGRSRGGEFPVTAPGPTACAGMFHACFGTREGGDELQNGAGCEALKKWALTPQTGSFVAPLRK